MHPASMKLGLAYSTHHNSEQLINLVTEIEHSEAFSCASAIQCPWFAPLLQVPT